MTKVGLDYIEDVAIISIEGEIYGENFADITNAFTVVFLKQIKNLIVDMSKASYINSQAISSFLSLNSKVANVEGKLIMAGMRGKVAKIFDMLRLRETFSMSVTAEKAVKELKS